MHGNCRRAAHACCCWPTLRPLCHAADVNDFVTHTSTLLTSLQTAMSGLLAGGSGSTRPASPLPALVAADAGACAPTRAGPLPQHIPPAVAAIHAFRLSQQQDAAQQVAAAQLASQAASHAEEAGPRGLVPVPRAAQPAAAGLSSAFQSQGCSDATAAPDALVDVALPPFSRRFSALPCTASTQPRSPAAVPAGCSNADSADRRGRDDSCSGAAGPENCPPEPRPLPPAMRSMVALPAGTASVPVSAFGCSTDFAWRPCSSACL